MYEFCVENGPMSTHPLPLSFRAPRLRIPFGLLYLAAAIIKQEPQLACPNREGLGRRSRDRDLVSLHTLSHRYLPMPRPPQPTPDYGSRGRQGTHDGFSNHCPEMPAKTASPVAQTRLRQA